MAKIPSPPESSIIAIADSKYNGRRGDGQLTVYRHNNRLTFEITGRKGAVKATLIATTKEARELAENILHLTLPVRPGR